MTRFMGQKTIETIITAIEDSVYVCILRGARDSEGKREREREMERERRQMLVAKIESEDLPEELI